jgi:hypothetical protein
MPPESSEGILFSSPGSGDSCHDFRLIGHAAFSQWEGHVFRDVEGIKQSPALKHDPDLPPDRAERTLTESGNFYAIHMDATALRRQQAGQMFQQDRFAPTRAAEDHQRFPVIDVQVHAAQHACLAEALRQPADLDERLGHGQ